VDTIANNLKAAYKDYSALKKQASSLRDTFLERLAAEQAHDQNLNVTSHLKMLQQQEWQCLAYRCICAINQLDRQHGRLMMVLTPDRNECHTKDSIEQACLVENQAHFNQASDTPLLQPPLYGLLGPLGTGIAASAILNGEFQYLENHIIQDTLNALQHCNPNNSLGSMRIQSKDYRNIWRHTKEKTSSCSKYGLHFGHYMAIIQDAELTDFHAMMIDITLMSGYSPM